MTRALLSLGRANHAFTLLDRLRAWLRGQRVLMPTEQAEHPPAPAPQPDPPAPPPPPKKPAHVKALLVGINAYAAAPLRGCVNDATAMRDLLQAHYGLTEANTCLLLDEQATGAAIREGLHWLAAPASDGPQIRVFHFAGHGVQVPDKNGDEPDGLDEALAPYDYATGGVLTDDMLRKLYKSFLPTTHLLLLMDCCHSGDIQFATDGVLNRFLKLDYTPEEQEKIEQAKHLYDNIVRRPLLEQLSRGTLSPRAYEQATSKKGFGRAEAASDFLVLLAAARSDQTAADAKFGDTFNGALTHYLVEALRSNPQRPYAALVDEVRDKIAARGFTQVPQIEGSAANVQRAFLRP